MSTRRRTLFVVFILLIGAWAAPRTALAQVDFSGSWSPLYHEDGPDRIPGPELGDYTGLPLNELGRLRADSYDPDRIAVVPEYPCREHGGQYTMRGLSNLRILAVHDPVDQHIVGFDLLMGNNGHHRVIHLDGRPHPSERAPHTWQGFSTAVWEGNMLSIRTTHLKASYTRRNGVPSSDRRTVTEHWMLHGPNREYLTVVTVDDDPVLLTEPLVQSSSWFLDPGQNVAGNFNCDAVQEVPTPAGRPVPHYLPDTNPNLKEFSEWYGIPYEATRGGAETIYPEYRKKLPQSFSTLETCGRYCTCMNVGAACPVR